jgi:hypothetical protein
MSIVIEIFGIIKNILFGLNIWFLGNNYQNKLSFGILKLALLERKLQSNKLSSETTHNKIQKDSNPQTYSFE